MFELDSIKKSFGGVQALAGASLSLAPGRVHGLVGENGAGKSTLMNIATGLYTPDAGTLRLAGAPLTLRSPRDAAARGILLVHQEAELFPQLSVAENMLLGEGLVRGPAGLIRWGATKAQARARVQALGEDFDVSREAGGLPVAHRTLSEIAAAVARSPRVLFLDEPTAALARREIDRLFTQIRRLRDAGVAIVYVSHRLDEVLELCDEITVLRDGANVRTAPAAEWTTTSLVAAMVGREGAALAGKRTVTLGAERLRVESLSTRDGRVREVSISLRAGEVLGLYGFVGAGRTEFAEALFGLRRVASGTVQLDGAPIRPAHPAQAVRAGLAYLPEDRLQQSIFAEHPLRANASVASIGRLGRAGWVNGAREQRLADEVMSSMRVRAASTEQAIGTLSGGNQQKVVFGRWGATEPKVLLLDEPTRGVDVGAKGEIHRLICDLAERGTAVLMISSELPEIMAMSDRVAVFCEGKLAGIFDPKTDAQADIAAAAVPASGEAAHGDAPRTGAVGKILRQRELGLAGFIFAICALMGVLRTDQFLTAQNLLDIVANAAIPAILAQGAMLIICTGGIDISVGALLGLAGALAGLAAQQGWPPLLCLPVAMLVGVAGSSVNAGLALAARIHPIIVTLAGLSVYRGIMRLVTGGYEVAPLPDAYRALADGALFGVPKLVWYVVLVTLLAQVFLRYSLPGRRVLALGNSEKAARLIGLSKARLMLMVYALSGVCVGLAAVLHAGYYGKVQSNTGEGMELQAIAAAVIGGTNILGGRGSAFGTLLGAVLVALLGNSLVLLRVSSYWQLFFVGALIVLAVSIDALLQRRSAAR